MRLYALSVYPGGTSELRKGSYNGSLPEFGMVDQEIKLFLPVNSGIIFVTGFVLFLHVAPES